MISLLCHSAGDENSGIFTIILLAQEMYLLPGRWFFSSSSASIQLTSNDFEQFFGDNISPTKIPRTKRDGKKLLLQKRGMVSK